METNQQTDSKICVTEETPVAPSLPESKEIEIELKDLSLIVEKKTQESDEQVGKEEEEEDEHHVCEHCGKYKYDSHTKNEVAFDLFEKLPLSQLAASPLTFTKLSDKFPLYAIHNFLSASECAWLIEFGKEDLKPSVTIREDSQGISEGRTSDSAFLTQDGIRSPHPVLANIQLKVSALTWCPIEHIEGINLTHYQDGKLFGPHHDYFGPENKCSRGNAGDRFCTFFVYLNDVKAEHKGRTRFDRLGVSVQPVQGDCVFWLNTTVDPSSTIYFEETEHEGEVVENAEKWALNIWVRQRSYRSPALVSKS